MPVDHYASVREFVRDVAPPDKPDTSDFEWYGNQTFKDACENVFKGRPESYRQAEKLVDRLTADGIETNFPVWENARVGFMPCVPSYLAGSPESMRIPIKRPSESAPLRIYVSCTHSAGFSAEQIQTRGCYILALTQKLVALRPVELYVFGELSGQTKKYRDDCAIAVVRLETSPLDLATVSYALTDAAFLRRLMFAHAYRYSFDGGWAFNLPPNDAKQNSLVRKAIDAADSDLIIHGSYWGDPLMVDPVKWLDAQVKKFSVQDGT